ncbi:hypothetical protein [Leisingera methylohalidivorans]|uniref:Uncharacterized protein n=1 Tax=Leisingera methylohalidivorans DSM 14336 TaxID=999552 RepID=V9VZP5_9RHOB|nr:hypothetical protein [Leisingera methylohalidivorans]AHD02840.1 hypothetical protein METH_02365 [Leisingera methylohalidivorans DSM 14336]
MDQTFQPEFAAVAEGPSAAGGEAEILASVRRILTTEVSIDPEIAQAAAKRGWFAGNGQASERAIKSSLAARLLGRFRG